MTEELSELEQQFNVETPEANAPEAIVEDVAPVIEDEPLAHSEPVEQSEPEAPSEPVIEQNEPTKPSVKGARDWFVVHRYSGYENKVKANLERRIHSMQMQNK